MKITDDLINKISDKIAEDDLLKNEMDIDYSLAWYLINNGFLDTAGNILK